MTMIDRLEVQDRSDENTHSAVFLNLLSPVSRLYVQHPLTIDFAIDNAMG